MSPPSSCAAGSDGKQKWYSRCHRTPGVLGALDLKLLKIPLGATLSIVEDLQRNWKDLEASTRKLKVGKSKAW
jgi:hypothetical protein